jgi:hypothetical protein
MKKFETRDTVEFGPGTVLGLTSAQAHARTQSLTPVRKGIWQTLRSVTFKRGEVIGIDDADGLPRYLSDRLEARATRKSAPDAPHTDPQPSLSNDPAD